MPWIRFHVPFNWHVKPAVTVAFKAGDYLVTQACADQAIAKGAAEEIRRPARAKVNTDAGR